MSSSSGNENANIPSRSRSRTSPISRFWGDISSIHSNHNFNAFGRNRTLPSDDDKSQIILKTFRDSPHAPIDLIFVHGLNGHFVKTWTSKESTASFWPRDWLPTEEGLENARIHAFGYPAALKDKRKTEFDIDVFGKLLFTHISQSKTVKDVPIIFIAHSMGGLIVKEAFLHAYEERSTSNLHSRIRGMIFLATPHQGSDLLRIMQDIFRITDRPKFLQSLSRGSKSLTTMNREFEELADDLHLYSFFELLPTTISKITGTSILVVDRHSAEIGLPHEKRIPLEANHRDICKFNSKVDSNYRQVRDVIVAVVKNILNKDASAQAENERAQLDTLRNFLCIDTPAINLESIAEEKVDGSCGWIVQNMLFLQWRDVDTGFPAVFWITGNPGTGKTILAAHVANHLKEQGESVCYYFCRGGQKQQSASDLIRHLAFQMAEHHPIIREGLLALIQRGREFIETLDPQLLWKRLFIDHILTLPLDKRQTWVIDGLDESESILKAIKFFSDIKSKASPQYPINLYLSSRIISETRYSAFSGPKYRHAIEPEDTRDDITRYIAAHNQLFTHFQPDDEEALRNTLEFKADACFLWLKLVMGRMEQLHTTRARINSVEDIPEGLNLLYQQILNEMEQAQSEKSTTRAILTWTVHAARTLTLEELRAAIKINGQEKIDIDPAEQTIKGLCGQLVRVERSGEVRPAHFTVTEFLRNDSITSKLIAKRRDAHEQLATMCLQYLCSDDFKPPQAPQLLLMGQRAKQSPIADYAAVSWSKHVMASSSESDSLAALIHSFLTTNVLSWIEFIARQKKSLYEVIQTAKNLRNYLDRRAKHVSPINKHYSEIDRWIIDLLRVSTKFGRNLLLYPSATHFVVPPLCPRNSSIHTAFTTSSQTSISLKGAILMDWDDCVSYNEYRTLHPNTVASGRNLFAVGLSKHVKVFDGITLQEAVSLNHGETVYAVLFDSSNTKIATAGFKEVKLWTVQGNLLWKAQLKGNAPFLTFSTVHDSLTVYTGGQFMSWRIANGTSLAVPEKTSRLQRMGRRVLSLSMSADLSILAVAFFSGPAQVWSITNGSLLGSCEVDGESAQQVLLSPREDFHYLAVSYEGDTLATFHTLSQSLIASASTEVTSMALTPDGLTLATGDKAGTIKFWDFETLQLVYRITSPNDLVCCLSFSLDGLRLFDLRPARSMVWEPTFLVRKSSSDSSTISESVQENDPEIPIYNHQESKIITAMLVVDGLDYVFVGKRGGDVCAYDLRTGLLSSMLYSHNEDTHVASISFHLQNKYLATADGFSVLRVEQIEIFPPSSKRAPRARATISRIAFKSPIHGIYFRPDGSHLLVHHSSLEIMPLAENDFQRAPASDLGKDKITCLTWIQHDNTYMIIGANGQGALRVIRFKTNGQLSATDSTIELANQKKVKNEFPMKRILCSDNSQYIVVELDICGKPKHSAPGLLVYRSRDIMTACETKTRTGSTKLIEPIAYLLAEAFISLLGCSQIGLVFLDANLWIRSCKLTRIPHGDSVMDLDGATRHLFITNEIVEGIERVPGVATKARAAIFSRRGELVIIQQAVTGKY